MVVARTMPEEEADFETIRLEDQARLDGVRLAARTLEHHLTNHLTLTVGYAELIAEDPELPERLREMAHLVLESAQAAVERVRRMRQVESVNLIDLGIPGGPLLDDGARPGW
jgi:hypothetical protein